MWTRPEQFELLIRFAATLAEDLFRMGRLMTAAVDAEAPMSIRRVHDLELWLDRLAVAQPVADPAGAGAVGPARKNMMTFAPDGARGVAAFVGGEKAASA